MKKDVRQQRCETRLLPIGKSTFGPLGLLLLCCCATTPKEKLLRNSSAAFALGAALGSTKEEYKTQHTLMYGSLFALTAGALTLIYDEGFEDSKKIKEENKRLQAELDRLFQPKAEGIGPATMGAKIPEKYQSLISPGEWRVLAIDQWIEDGENRLIHQDKIMELNPPSLKPITLPIQNGEKK